MLGVSFDLVANVNYNDKTTSVKEVTKFGLYGFTEPSDKTNNRLHSTAKLIANIWLHYKGHTGRFKKIDLGFGLQYFGDRYGDDDNTFVLPSYTKAEVVAKYHWNSNLTLGLSIRNLFDTFYYEGSLGFPYYMEEGEPRSIFLSLRSRHGF